MDRSNEPSTLMGSLLPSFSTALTSLRERSRTLLRDQDERLKEFEAKLESQFIAALERLEQEPKEIAAAEQKLFDKVDSLEREVRHLQQLRRESDAALDEARLMLGELEEERRILRDRLDEAEREPSGESSATDTGEVERLTRRLEMAMAEIRELKSQREECGGGPAAAAVPVTSDLGQFDWETQKKRLLQQLESSFDSKDSAQAQEKLRCEQVIRATDRAIAEKDREIAELRKQLSLAEQAGIALAAHQSGADAAAQQILDADELVRTERERLAQLQAEWQEKLRRAEVEVSIERAKIARERQQLEEKLRSLPSQGAGEASGATDGKQAGRGRWLTRLGLGGDEKEGS